jgi:hypothetical protein
MFGALTLGRNLGAWTGGARTGGVFSDVAERVQMHPLSYLHARHLVTYLHRKNCYVHLTVIKCMPNVRTLEGVLKIGSQACWNVARFPWHLFPTVTQPPSQPPIYQPSLCQPTY